MKTWLHGLKDVVYDAEDLLDEINTESYRCKVEGESKAFTTKVRSFVSSRSKIFYKNMNSKLEDLSKKLENYVNQKDRLMLQIVLDQSLIEGGQIHWLSLLLLQERMTKRRYGKCFYLMMMRRTII